MPRFPRPIPPASVVAGSELVVRHPDSKLPGTLTLEALAEWLATSPELRLPLKQAITSASVTGGKYVYSHGKNTDLIVPTLYDDKGRVVTNLTIQKDRTDSKNKLIIWIPITISGTWLLIVQWWPE